MQAWVSEGPEGDQVLREFAHKVADYAKTHDLSWGKYGEEA
jgi:hypothetical protein